MFNMRLLRSKRDHVTPILLELHWLPVKSRITFKMLFLTFKCLQGSCTSIFISTSLSAGRIARHAVYAFLISYFLNICFVYLGQIHIYCMYIGAPACYNTLSHTHAHVYAYACAHTHERTPKHITVLPTSINYSN